MNASRRFEPGVLDASTLVLLPGIDDAELLPLQPLITAVTLAELSVGPLVANTEEERMARQAHLQQAEADFEPLPFDAGCRVSVRPGRRVASPHGVQTGCAGV